MSLAEEDDDVVTDEIRNRETSRVFIIFVNVCVGRKQSIVLYYDLCGRQKKERGGQGLAVIYLIVGVGELMRMHLFIRLQILAWLVSHPHFSPTRI